MANYDIPTYPTKRLRYFNNQFLNDQDFIDDSSSPLAHQRAFLRSLCVAGVWEGLVVSYPAANQPPSVSPGVAVDRTGRMIVLEQATGALAGPGGLADGTYVVHISFLETEDNRATGQGAQDYTRWKQTPAINLTATNAALPVDAVVLGSCTVTAGQFVGSGTTSGRQYSGLRLPGPGLTLNATLRNSGAADDLAVLGGSLAIRRDSTGQIGPTLTLQNSASGNNAGAAIDFNGYDPGTNDPSLRIQSHDDGNASSHLTFSTKQPGPQTNRLVERLRLTSDGVLKFPNEASKDKIVIWDGGATDRFGIGLAASNINLFYPTTARFSLRQNSNSGTEVFSVSGSGTATIRRDVAGLGPTLTLLNGSAPSTTGGAGGAIDFNGYDPGTNLPTLRIQSLHDGNYSSHLTFLTKAPGDQTNALVERLRLTSDGVLKFPNDVPKDKIVIWDNGTNCFGMGLNNGNLNLFYPPANYFSLRQNGSSGTEVFRVDGSGKVTLSGPIVPKTGNNASSGIQFPSSPDGSDYAFLRYYFPTGEQGKLVLGIEDNAEDALTFWQAGRERVNISNDQITFYFPRGRWVFQSDGNLVKYNSNGAAIWALPGGSGPEAYERLILDAMVGDATIFTSAARGRRPFGLA